MSRIAELLSYPATRCKRASLAQIDELCAKIGMPVPETLVELWRKGGQITLEELDAEILGPEELLRELAAENDWVRDMVAQGILPFYDDHQSNYIAVHVRPPLAFRVRYVPHDSGPTLLYRSFDGFLEALLQGLATPEFTSDDFGGATGDYKVNGPRTDEDLQAARALLNTDGAHGEWNEAMGLLSAFDTAEWQRLLEKGGRVRRHALAWLEEFDLPWVREVLEQDHSAFIAWMDQLVDACAAAGFAIDERRPDALKVAGMWLNLKVFYDRRHARRAMPRTILWIGDMIAKRHPYHREDHLMLD